MNRAVWGCAACERFLRSLENDPACRFSRPKFSFVLNVIAGKDYFGGSLILQNSYIDVNIHS